VAFSPDFLRSIQRAAFTERLVDLRPLGSSVLTSLLTDAAYVAHIKPDTLVDRLRAVSGNQIIALHTPPVTRFLLPMILFLFGCLCGLPSCSAMPARGGGIRNTIMHLCTHFSSADADISAALSCISTRILSSTCIFPWTHVLPAHAHLQRAIDRAFSSYAPHLTSRAAAAPTSTSVTMPPPVLVDTFPTLMAQLTAAFASAVSNHVTTRPQLALSAMCHKYLREAAKLSSEFGVGAAQDDMEAAASLSLLHGDDSQRVDSATCSTGDYAAQLAERIALLEHHVRTLYARSS
jgi:hypothetical protein